MSSFSMRLRVSLFILILAASNSTKVIGAEPKVVKASHTQTAKEDVRDIDDSKAEDMSYSPQWPEPPNTGAMLLRLCIGTFTVLGLCVGTMWFGKPWLQKLKVAGAGSPSLYIEGSVAVGNRAMLYLVRVGGTQLVAGTDATGLKSLIALPASFKDVLDEQVPDIDAETAPTRPVPQSVERAPRAATPVETSILTSSRPFEGRTFLRSDSKE